MAHIYTDKGTHKHMHIQTHRLRFRYYFTFYTFGSFSIHAKDTKFIFGTPQTYTDTDKHIHVQAHPETHTCTGTHRYRYTQMHAHTHTGTYQDIHRHMHVCTYTHRCAHGKFKEIVTSNLLLYWVRDLPVYGRNPAKVKSRKKTKYLSA